MNLDEQLKAIVPLAQSYRDVCRKLDISYRSYRNIKNRIQSLNLDTTHFISGGIFHNHKYTSKYIFVENSPTVINTNIKRRMIRDGLLQELCAMCGIGPEWNGSQLSLQIHHINGVSTDNRIDNLQLLCPNCHSQTHNFGAKNKKLKVPIIKGCEDNTVDFVKKENIHYEKKEKKEKKAKKKTHLIMPPVRELKKKSTTLSMQEIADFYGVCVETIRRWLKFHKIKKKIVRKTKSPTKDELLQLMHTYTNIEIGKMYNVSDRAVSKWQNNFGINRREWNQLTNWYTRKYNKLKFEK